VALLKTLRQKESNNSVITQHPRASIVLLSTVKRRHAQMVEPSKGMYTS